MVNSNERGSGFALFFTYRRRESGISSGEDGVGVENEGPLQVDETASCDIKGEGGTMYSPLSLKCGVLLSVSIACSVCSQRRSRADKKLRATGGGGVIPDDGFSSSAMYIFAVALRFSGLAKQY